ncbi:hypothetical protein [Terrabacter sp. Soil810]|uniref:hypothetical protein n=1 Tax=Terrabacter sp. Soil810 TaxID=1736418 RepID=UPI00070CC232|nr:hypothetical protein [Terrabacter sp. Soil810]KRF35500.1 hypothetical protein ASG96_18930 [Terrabacter sp. Soil810]
MLHAYIVKEQLHALLSLPTTADREPINHRLWKFYAQAAAVTDNPDDHVVCFTCEVPSETKS